MMTGRLAAADSVTSITGRQPPATMISAIHHHPAARVCEGGRPAVPSGIDYLRSSTTQSTMTASRQQVLASSSPIRASLPMNVPPDLIDDPGASPAGHASNGTTSSDPRSQQ